MAALIPRGELWTLDHCRSKKGRLHTAATEIKYRVVELVMSEANDARLWRDLEGSRRRVA